MSFQIIKVKSHQTPSKALLSRIFEQYQPSRLCYKPLWVYLQFSIEDRLAKFNTDLREGLFSQLEAQSFELIGSQEDRQTEMGATIIQISSIQEIAKIILPSEHTFSPSELVEIEPQEQFLPLVSCQKAEVFVCQQNEAGNQLDEQDKRNRLIESKIQQLRPQYDYDVDQTVKIDLEFEQEQNENQYHSKQYIVLVKQELQTMDKIQSIMTKVQSEELIMNNSQQVQLISSEVDAVQSKNTVTQIEEIRQIKQSKIQQIKNEIKNESSQKINDTNKAQQKKISSQAQPVLLTGFSSYILLVLAFWILWLLL